MSDPTGRTPPASGADSAAARRSRLNGIKLRALVRDHLADDSVAEAQEFTPGAALVHGDAAWVLLDHRPGARLGAALAWMLRADSAALHVIAEADTGMLARRAAAFDLPISVWHADDRTLLPAVPVPPTPPAPAPAEHEPLRELIVEGGADPVVEHGVLVGEVRGLEVCRVVADEATGEPRLEVGVGAHDRDAFQMIHGNVPTRESLARIVDAVAEHRTSGATQHPLSRLAAERMIRWRLQQQPDLVGAEWLAPASPPVPRPNLKDPVPCVAHGRGADGRPVTVVCASGVDLDLVPFAADARLARAADEGADDRGRLVLALPGRDRLRITEELAGLLREPAEFVTVD